MLNYKDIARKAFNQPVGANRNREEVIYDFFNYELMKQNLDPVEEGRDNIFSLFDEIFKDKTLDIYKMANEMDEVFPGAFDSIYQDYMYPRLNSMFSDWRRVNSINWESDTFKVLKDEEVPDSFHSHKVGYLDGYTYKDLVSKLGDPTWMDPHCKSAYEWVIELNDEIFCIYDYKIYIDGGDSLDYDYIEEELDFWSIGGTTDPAKLKLLLF